MTHTSKAKMERHHTPKGEDALDHIRAAVREIHEALGAAVSQNGEIARGDLAMLGKKISAVVRSIDDSLIAQNHVAKRHFIEAVAFLETTEKHVAKSMKASGKAVHESLRHALADARAAGERVGPGSATKPDDVLGSKHK